MEAKERKFYEEDCRRKVNASEANLMNQQSKEMEALQKKLETKMSERLKMREVEHNKIL